MSTATLEPEAQASKSPRQHYQPQQTHFSVTCQPLAARGNDAIAWRANVLDLSMDGIGLLLERRFEPRTGLAIELPEPDSDSTYTALARVAHVKAQPGKGWLLECTFVTPLTDDRLSTLLRLARTIPVPPLEEGTPQTAPLLQLPQRKTVITGVQFHTKLRENKVSTFRVDLHITGDWPLPVGRVIKVWLGKGPANRSAVDARVVGCYTQDGAWRVNCAFVNSPPPDLVRMLQR
jgi:hypothetical protein